MNGSFSISASLQTFTIAGMLHGVPELWFGIQLFLQILLVRQPNIGS
jgi:hypothetical protein